MVGKILEIDIFNCEATKAGDKVNGGALYTNLTLVIKVDI